MATKWTITDRVANRVKDMPTALGSDVISEYVEDAAQSVQSFTGLSISLTNIGSQYHPVITDLATMYALQYMSNVGVSYNLGRTRIDKKTEIDGINKQIMILDSRTQRQLNMLGKRVDSDVLNTDDTQLD